MQNARIGYNYLSRIYALLYRNVLLQCRMPVPTRAGDASEWHARWAPYRWGESTRVLLLSQIYGTIFCPKTYQPLT